MHTNIKNLRQFVGPHSVRWPLGARTIHGINKDSPGRSNGAGKSNLCASIEIILWGKAVVSTKLADVISWGEKEFEGTHTFEFKGDRYEITRKIKKSSTKLSLVVNGADISAQGAPETQKRINERIGTYSDYVRTVKWDDKYFSFARLTPKPRAEAFAALFPELQESAQVHVVASDRCKELRTQSDDLQFQIDKSSAEIKQIDEALLALPAQKQAWEDEQAQAITKQAESVQSAKEDLEAVQASAKKLAALKTDVASLKNQLKQYKSEDVGSLLYRKKRERDDLVEEYKAVNARKLSPGVCTSCGQSIPPENPEQVEAELERIKIRGSACKDEIRELEALQTKSSEKEELQLQIAGKEGEIRALGDPSKAVDKCERRVKEEAEALGKLRAAHWPGEAQRLELLEEKEKLETERSNIEAQKEAIDVELHTEQLLTDSTHPKVFNPRFLSPRLHLLNEAASAYINRLNPIVSGIELRYTYDEKTKGTLEIVAIREGVEVPYELLSTGQRAEADVAFGVAMGRLTTINPWGMLILDECIPNGLDPQGRRNVYALLSSLEERVYVVDHGFEQAWDSILVVMENDRGRVVDGAGLSREEILKL